MSDVKRVFVTLGPDRVQEGFYTFDGDQITMVYANGEPLVMDEVPVTATATPDTVEPIARMLTRRIRKWALGNSVPGFGRGESIGGRSQNTSSGFERDITYSSEGWI